MEFIDKTGHIFSINSYNTNPIGYEYEVNPYIFWVETDKTNYLSVNNYYAKPIRFIINANIENINEISIKADSKIFKLLSSSLVQNQIEQFSDITNDVIINDSNLTNELLFSNNDLLVLDKLKLSDNGAASYSLITFYVLCNSPEEGTWNSNILINVNTDIENTYTYITVGGVFKDEIEELIINGTNMGIELPKDIIRSLYKSSFYNYTFNTALYNEKVKEYLLNIMDIKGECGNFKSVINSLKWFGYGNKLTISKLLQTDNQFTDQFLNDYFDIYNDVIQSYKDFKNSSLISIYLNENIELDECFEQSFSNNDYDFTGEGNPKMENLFNKLEKVQYDENNIEFYKPFYDFTMQELAIKIACLKYYFSKYFLPIHIKINNTSIIHKCYTNPVKMINTASAQLLSKPVTIWDNTWDVEFPDSQLIYYYKQEKYLDNNFNEFSNYNEQYTEEEIYYSDNSCLSIPIKFKENKYYNCVLILHGDKEQIFESHFNFYNNDKSYFKNFVIIPHLLDKERTINYWINNKFTIELNVNNKWYSFSFIPKLPDFDIKIGKIKYRYFYDNEKGLSNFGQLSKLSYDSVTFNSFMYQTDFVSVNHINFVSDLCYYIKNISNSDKSLEYFVSQYSDKITISNNLKYLNKVHLFDIYQLSQNNNLIKYKYDPNESISDVYNKFFKNVTLKLLKESKNKPDEYIENGNFQQAIAYVYYNKSKGDLLANTWYQDGNDLSKYFYIYEQTSIEDKFDEIKDYKFGYDFYLMHENINEKSNNETAYWYGMFISKFPIASCDEDNELSLPEELNLEKFKLKYVNSENRFLINRMDYINSNGINNFEKDDFIVVNLFNNDRMYFDMFAGPKWVIKPASIGISKTAEVSSKSELAIIGIGENNITREPGYYNISVEYSIDGINQHQKTKKILFRINK